MNSQHVDVVNEMARKLLVNPPVAVLLEDSEGDWLKFGPVLISHATQESPSILGVVKKLGYAVDVEVACAGSTWDPPFTDYSEQGIYSTFSEAIIKAFSLWMEGCLQDCPDCDQGASQAYQEGYRGFKEGKSIEDNPYPADTDLHKVWLKGWRA